MKLYQQPEPPTLMRINIKKQGMTTQHIAVEEVKQQELLDWLKGLIEAQNLSIFSTGKITTVEVRESIKSENGKAVSFSFKGLDPIAVRDLILKELEAISSHFIKSDTIDGSWLSPVPSEREKQIVALKKIFSNYPNESPRWQYMNGLLTAILHVPTLNHLKP